MNLCKAFIACIILCRKRTHPIAGLGKKVISHFKQNYVVSEYSRAQPVKSEGDL